jgi:hypothetical protein
MLSLMEFLPRSQRLGSLATKPGEAIAVQVQHGSAILCGRCGCRLAPFGREPGPGGAWYHVRGAPGRDARGCSVDCLRLPHQFAEAPLD